MYGCHAINHISVSDGSGRDILMTRNPEYRAGKLASAYINPEPWETDRMKNPAKPLPIDVFERRKVRESYAYGNKVLGIGGLNPMESFHQHTRRGPRPFDRARASQLNSREYKGVLAKSKSMPSLYMTAGAAEYATLGKPLPSPVDRANVDEIKAMLAQGREYLPM
jgi:hypothetical protein